MKKNTKFRFYDNTKKLWMNSNGITWYMEDGSVTYDVDHDGPTEHYSGGPHTVSSGCDAPEVHQSIGLTDINGKDIYEGDIIKWIGKHPMKCNFVVEYFEDRACWGCSVYRTFMCFEDFMDMDDDMKTLNEKFEVVGNIINNPELDTRGKFPDECKN